MAQLVVQTVSNYAPCYRRTEIGMAAVFNAMELYVRMRKKIDQNLLNGTRTVHVENTLNGLNLIPPGKRLACFITVLLLGNSRAQLWIDQYITGAKKVEEGQVYNIIGKTSCSPYINKTIRVLSYGARAVDLVAVPLAVSRLFSGHKTRITTGVVSGLFLAFVNWGIYINGKEQADRGQREV